MKYALFFSLILLFVLPVRAEKIAIAVLDLDAKGIGPGVANALTETVRFEFAKQESIDLVAREKMLDLAKEKAIQLSGITEDSTVVQVGKALNVKKMVIGSVTKLEGKYSLFLRVVDVEKENVECSESEDVGVEPDSLKRAAPRIVHLLSDCLQVRQKPNDPEAYFRYGKALMDQKKYESAEKQFREIIRLFPTDTFMCCSAHGQLAGALMMLGDNTEASFEFYESIKLLPDSVKHTAIGVELFRLRKYDEAEKELREAKKLDPYDQLVYSTLGEVLLAQGKIEGAIAAYREAIHWEPENAQNHISLGQILSQQKKYKDAEKEFRDANYWKKDDPVALGSLALTLDNEGKRKEARYFWELALKLEKHPNIIELIRKRLAQPD